MSGKKILKKDLMVFTGRQRGPHAGGGHSHSESPSPATASKLRKVADNTGPGHLNVRPSFYAKGGVVYPVAFKGGEEYIVTVGDYEAAEKENFAEQAKIESGRAKGYIGSAVAGIAIGTAAFFALSIDNSQVTKSVVFDISNRLFSFVGELSYKYYPENLKDTVTSGLASIATTVGGFWLTERRAGMRKEALNQRERELERSYIPISKAKEQGFKPLSADVAAKCRAGVMEVKSLAAGYELKT